MPHYLFTSDELVLALVSLVRATRPAMLRQESDGFSVDFEQLSLRKSLTADDRLLMKMRTGLEPPPDAVSTDDPAPDSLLTLELEPAEAERLAATLKLLEIMQAWPDDVVSMSRDLRARLTTAP